MCFPTSLCAAKSRKRSLIQIMDEYIIYIGAVSVVWPSSQHCSPKLRAFVDYMAEHLLSKAPPHGRLATDVHANRARWRQIDLTIHPNGYLRRAKAGAQTKTSSLANGLRVVHQQGLAGASVRDIIEGSRRAAGLVFNNHFASKEAFGVEILDLYFGFTRKVLAETLDNIDLKPLKRLEAYIDANRRSSNNGAWKTGAYTEPTPPKLLDMTSLSAGAWSRYSTRFRVHHDGRLQAAVKVGELPRDLRASATKSATSSYRPCRSDSSLERRAGHLPDLEVQARPLRQHLALTRTGTF